MSQPDPFDWKLSQTSVNLEPWQTLCSLPASCAGAGPFPAVLDLYTLGGGVSEKRAALLASRGFVVLALALYGHDDLPKNVTELHLDYFEEAVEFLKVQNKVSCQRRGLVEFHCKMFVSDQVVQVEALS